jgi:hypothetical protein
LVISSHKSRDGASKARQWACPRLISVVCAESTLNISYKTIGA